MHLSRPTVKNELNLTTVVAVLGVLVTFATIFVKIGGFQASVLAMQAESLDWKSRTEARVAVLETRAGELDTLAYRLSVQERNSRDIGDALKELQKAVAAQSADIRVIRQVLTRDGGFGDQ